MAEQTPPPPPSSLIEAWAWRLQQLRAKRDRGEALTAGERTEAIELAEQVFLSQRADRIKEAAADPSRLEAVLRGWDGEVAAMRQELEKFRTA